MLQSVPGHFCSLQSAGPLNMEATITMPVLNFQECSGVCTQSTAWLSEAVSPAFLIDGYDFSSPKYSAWTESVWKTISGKFAPLL